MITINGVSYKSYAEVIIELLDEVSKLTTSYNSLSTEYTSLSNKYDELSSEVSSLKATIADLDLNTVVRTTDTEYKTLVSDDATHNTNWTNICTDLAKLGD